MGELLLIFILLGFITISAIFFIFYKKGELLNFEIVIGFVIMCIISILYIGYTSLPSNFVFDRNMYIVRAILIGGTFILYLKKKRDNRYIKYFLSAFIIEGFLSLLL